MEQKGIFESSIWKVFEVFVDDPLSIHYIKEISRKINLSPTSVKIHLENLEKENIVIKSKGERFFGFLANRDNPEFLFYKKIHNLIKIKNSGLLEYIKKRIYPKTIILYGSYLKGEDVKESDIDLFIISDVKKELELGRYENILNRKIHILLEKDLQRLNKNLKSELLNGYILEGYLKNG